MKIISGVIAIFNTILGLSFLIFILGLIALVVFRGEGYMHGELPEQEEEDNGQD